MKSVIILILICFGLTGSEVTATVTLFMESGDMKYFNVSESVAYTCKPYLDQISEPRRRAILNQLANKGGKSDEFSRNLRSKYELVEIVSETVGETSADCKISLKTLDKGIIFPMICRLIKTGNTWEIYAFDAELPSEIALAEKKKILDNFLLVESKIGEDNMPMFLEDLLINGMTTQDAFDKYTKK